MKRLLLALALAVCLQGRAAPDGCFVPRTNQKDITEPTQKALIVHSMGTEDLILQVRYEGAVEDFAWIVPTPTRPRIGRASETLFFALSEFTSPGPERAPATGSLGGGGFGGGTRGGVEVLDRQQVGMYDVSVLDATDSGALVDWLRRNEYAVSSRLTRLFDDYIRRGWYFTAMRINARASDNRSGWLAQIQLTTGTIQPLRLTFQSPVPIYPLKVSSLNGGTTDLLLYLMTDVAHTASGFKVAYSRRVAAGELNRLTGGLPAIGHAMWLTKLKRRMPALNMTRDLVFFPVAVRQVGSR